MALTIAAAIAIPASLPTWPVPDGAEKASPAVRGDCGAPAHPALNGIAPRAAWHLAGLAYSDPSDEPDEGSDGWVPAPDRALPAQIVPAAPVADRLGLASVASVRSPLPVGTLCRLRC